MGIESVNTGPGSEDRRKWTVRSLVGIARAEGRGGEPLLVMVSAARV